MKTAGPALILLMLCTGLVYSNHFDNSFHFDDAHTIVTNAAIRDLRNIPTFFTDGSTFSSLPANQSYRPMVTTLNAIDYALAGNDKTNTFWFHLSVFTSFLLTGCLLFSFVRYLLQKVNTGGFVTETALVVTVWFWLHPANAETINYIIARSDSFSTCMVLLSFVMYLQWPFAQKYYLWLLPFAIGFLTKETAIMFVPLLLLYELLFIQQQSLTGALISWRKTITIFKKLFALFLTAAVLLLLYRQMMPGSWRGGGNFSDSEYIMTQPFAMLHYFKNFLLPINLVADAAWMPVTTLTDYRFVTGMAFLILFLAAAVWFSRRPRFRVISFGLLWFFLALLPVSLVPLAELVNDHRSFFPYIGLFIAMAGVLQLIFQKESRLTRHRFFPYGMQSAVLVLLVGLALATRKRNQVWHSEYSLWKEVTVKAPQNGRGWMNFGVSQMEAGDFAGAAHSFQKAKSLLPGYAYVYINLGVLHAAGKKYEEAEDNFKTALLLDPGIPEAYLRYASFLIGQQRKDEAVVLINKGLTVSPGHAGLNALKQQTATAQ